MSPVALIEERWGVPFWDLLSDFVDQGFNRKQTAMAIGYGKTLFLQLLRDRPELDPFPPVCPIPSYVKDTGESLRSAVQRMAAEGMTRAEAARAVGYRCDTNFKEALAARGIEIEFPSRDPIAKLEKRTGKSFEQLVRNLADSGFNKGQTAQRLGLGSGALLNYHMKRLGIEVQFQSRHPGPTRSGKGSTPSADHPYRRGGHN